MPLSVTSTPARSGGGAPPSRAAIRSRSAARAARERSAGRTRARVGQPSAAPAPLEPVGVGDERGQRLHALGRGERLEPLARAGRLEQRAGAAQHLLQRPPAHRLGGQDEQLVLGRRDRRAPRPPRSPARAARRATGSRPASAAADSTSIATSALVRSRPHHVARVAQRRPQARAGQGRRQSRLRGRAARAGRRPSRRGPRRARGSPPAPPRAPQAPSARAPRASSMAAMVSKPSVRNGCRTAE